VLVDRPPRREISMRRTALAAAVVALLAGTVFAASAAGRHSTPRIPSIDPSNFVLHVTNPFFPLKPGTVLVYTGIKDGKGQTDRVTVTHRTKIIEGVRTTAVRDVATHRGNLLEATTDWYAQDKQGNVWYFGEATKSYEGGHVSTEGSWLAGRNGARPGKIMEADPHVPDAYRQEFSKGVAEDMAWVVRRRASLQVPYGRVKGVVLTLEWTRLEPNVVDKKFYGKGIGIVREASMAGAKETATLVRVHH
jgi:hypothetical protein